MKTYEPQIYELLEWWLENKRDDPLYQQELFLPEHLQPWVGIAMSEGLMYREPRLVVTEFGRSALALRESVPATEEKSKPVDDKERVLVVLSIQERLIMEALWDCETGMRFTQLMCIPKVFRETSSQSEEAMREKIKKMKRKLCEAGLPYDLSISGDRLKLIRPPG